MIPCVSELGLEQKYAFVFNCLSQLIWCSPLWSPTAEMCGDRWSEFMSETEVGRLRRFILGTHEWAVSAA